jgi:hypothetical protein
MPPIPGGPWKCCTRAARDSIIHKETVVASVRCVSAPTAREVRTFGTTTSELLALSDWLDSHA